MVVVVLVMVVVMVSINDVDFGYGAVCFSVQWWLSAKSIYLVGL